MLRRCTHVGEPHVTTGRWPIDKGQRLKVISQMESRTDRQIPLDSNAEIMCPITHRSTTTKSRKSWRPRRDSPGRGFSRTKSECLLYVDVWWVTMSHSYIRFEFWSSCTLIFVCYCTELWCPKTPSIVVLVLSLSLSLSLSLFLTLFLVFFPPL